MPSPPASRALEFLLSDPLHTQRVVPDPLPRPASGSVLLRVERFVLTSNNLTYARFGRQLGYWAPFPARAPEWGRVPAWGAARIVDGDPALAAPGELFTGFLPMATHVLVRAEPRPDGLRATAPERADMHPLYRDLTRIDDSVGDAELAVTAGVAPTAAHLADDLGERSPAQVVFSSATSRTALTTAVVLREAGTRIIGLTAAERTGIAARTGVFDVVLPYDDIADLPAVADTVYVDIAGNPAVTAAVHRTLGSALVRSVGVGVTHTATPSGPATPPGPPVERFNVGARRIEVAARIGEPEMEARERAARGSLAAWAAEHLGVERTTGLDQARSVWQRIERGDADPLTAAIIVPA
ncbi:DUF2855 family protein [Saccharopolyspora indica]|uniref:DUF2855 family protein n=1 Tax=Saccharopolyspora indica TaxID=1229659 RepID=UPI0022EB051F|nr:DUF2855 family protein [Saccharopolyspora indica]MDA3644499.1 DUF2855 family protein [Saccharopolyspora indica]